MKTGARFQDVIPSWTLPGSVMREMECSGTRMQLMARQAIYLDHNAGTALLPEARDAMLGALEATGNPSSVHAHGRAARALVETARDKVARLAGAERAQLVFTASASEAIAQGVIGGARAFAAATVIAGQGEHSAVLRGAEATGLPIRTIRLTADGVLDLDQLADEIGRADAAGETALVAVGWVNTETGVVQPMDAINALVGPTRHVLFVDAAQAFGKRDLDFSASAPDMMAVSAHKIGGAAGAGALFVKGHADGARLVPGGGQEQNRRGGTEAVAAIAAFGAACDAFGERYGAADVAGLSAALEAGLMALAPEAVIFGQGAERIGNTVYFAVPGLKASVAMMGLDLMGISVSSGSACSSGKVGASHVLAAMGVAPALAECALRVSLGWSSSEADVAGFLAGFAGVLERHRGRHGRAA